MRDISFSEVGGKGIILNLNNGKYYILNRTATEIFKIILKSNNFDEIYSKVSKKYTSKKVGKDLEDFLNKLKKLKILK